MSKYEDLVVETTNGAKLKLTEELGVGGQGAVYKTVNKGIAVKLKFKDVEELEFTDEEYKTYKDKIESILILPEFADINLCKPIELLQKPNCGYVMELLNELKPVSKLFFKKNELRATYYATGGLKKRIEVILELARTLNKLHSNGIVYGDISHSNIFYADTEGYSKVWLIDCDNLTNNTIFKSRYYTPGYGAPEIVSGQSHCTTFSDTYSFAVLAFKILFSMNPCEEVYDDDDDDGGWSKTSETTVVKKMTYIGQKNPLVKYLANKKLNDLFSEIFSDECNLIPYSRPSMFEWFELFQEIYCTIVKCQCEEDYSFYNILENKVEKHCSNCNKLLNKDVKLTICSKIPLNKLDVNDEFYLPSSNKYVFEKNLIIYNGFVLNSCMIDNFASTKYPEDLLQFDFDNNCLIVKHLNKKEKISCFIDGKEKNFTDSIIINKGDSVLFVIVRNEELDKYLSVGY